MSINITVPDDAVSYILFQRTSYLSFLTSKLFKLNPWLYNQAVILEAVLRRERVKQLFTRGILAEYEAIKPSLPGHVGAILDIGCGVGGIDILLYKHYNSDVDVQLYLLDKTESSRHVYYGFEQNGAFYNSLKVTEAMLSHNGVPRENIHLLTATPDYRIQVETNVDLVISLLSWGFHYPVSTYIAQVYDILGPGGYLIIDIRKGTGGEKELEQRFAKIQIMSEDGKHRRVLAIK